MDSVRDEKVKDRRGKKRKRPNLSGSFKKTTVIVEEHIELTVKK